MTMSFGPACFDLVHSRSVLMHVEDPDTVVEHLGAGAGAGAVVLFEETDGERRPTTRGTELPGPFATSWCHWRCSGPGRGPWRPDSWASASPTSTTTSARTCSPGVLRPPPSGVRPSARSAPSSPTRRGWSRGRTRPSVDDTSYDAMIELLENPAFAAPFAARHRVSARVGRGVPTVMRAASRSRSLLRGGGDRPRLSHRTGGTCGLGPACFDAHGPVLRDRRLRPTGPGRS